MIHGPRNLLTMDMFDFRNYIDKIINSFQYEEANTIDKGGYNVIDNPPSGSPEMKSISTWVSRTMANINNLLIH